MTTESIQFFGFFAAVFVFCAVAEWMFAAEAVNYARRRNLGKPFVPTSLACHYMNGR